MKVYQSRYPILTGSSYHELERNARRIYITIAKRTKRNAYVRSTYFKGEKVFLKLFWEHLNQKPRSDRRRRLHYFQCAIDLLRNNLIEPKIENSTSNTTDIHYRFTGRTLEGNIFYVQVKQNRRKNKYFMSVFPDK